MSEYAETEAGDPERVNTKVTERYQRDWRDWNDALAALLRVLGDMQSNWLGRKNDQRRITDECISRFESELQFLDIPRVNYEVRSRIADDDPCRVVFELVDLKEEAWEKARIEALEKGLKDDQ